MKKTLLAALLLLVLVGTNQPVFSQEIIMYQFYVCNQVGTGSHYDPYRPAIANLSVAWDGAGIEWYQGIDNPARRYWIGLVSGSAATHDLCETVATPLLPDRLNVVDDLDGPLDSLWDSLPDAVKTARVAVLEAKAISAGWLNPSTSIRDVIRYGFRACYFAQMAEGDGNANLLNLLSRNLDVTVGQLPVGIRNAGRDWINSRGLSTAWMTNQTTIRQIVHYVVENLGFGVIRFNGKTF
jgi:hypothetical protein